MVIFAAVGTFNDIVTAGSIRGNGKTLTITYYGYDAHKKGKKVYSNYRTTFSDLITINELITLFKNSKLRDTIILLDEAQMYFPNQGLKTKVIKELIGLFIAQTRKASIDIYLSTQRYNNLNNQLRLHIDEILLPIKIHADGSICKKDSCTKKHYINVYIPDVSDPIVTLDAQKVGQLYDTNEMVLDTYQFDDTDTEKRTRVK